VRADRRASRQVFPMVEPRSRYQASCYGDILREQMRGFHDLLRQKPTSVHIVGMELNLNGISNNAIHVSGFNGEDLCS
jgi:hypothetical protein